MSNTAEDARRVVASVKFGPGAARGLAAGTRPDRWGLGARMPDFAQAANAQSLVCVQLEHETALHNIDAILAVDGIDVFFIGPSDLSQSMGYPGNPKAPPVAKAIETTLAQDRGRRPHARHARDGGQAGRGNRQGLPLHLYPSAAPAGHGRRRIPEAETLNSLPRPQIHIVYDFGLWIAVGMPVDLDMTPRRALKCLHHLRDQVARTKKTSGEMLKGARACRVKPLIRILSIAHFRAARVLTPARVRWPDQLPRTCSDLRRALRVRINPAPSGASPSSAR